MEDLLEYLNTQIALKSSSTGAFKVIKKLCTQNKLKEKRVPITYYSIFEGRNVTFTETPMFFAAEINNVDLVNLLLACEVDPRYDEICHATRCSEIFEIFLRRGISEDRIQNLAIMIACNMNGGKEEFECLKLTAQHDIKFQGRTYDIVYDVCKGVLSKKKAIERIEFLSMYRSKWSPTHSFDGRTALFADCHPKLIEYLLKEGAEINYKDFNDETALTFHLSGYYDGRYDHHGLDFYETLSSDSDADSTDEIDNELIEPNEIIQLKFPQSSSSSNDYKKASYNQIRKHGDVISFLSNESSYRRDCKRCIKDTKQIIEIIRIMKSYGVELGDPYQRKIDKDGLLKQF